MLQQLQDIEVEKFMNNLKNLANKKCIAGFVTAGDPDIKQSEEIILKMFDANIDLVVVGIPFSDPIAEDIVVQRANIRALENGVLTNEVFEMIKNVSKDSDTPIVLKSYLNILFKYGYDRFFEKAKMAKVSGVLIPDMPYEEMDEVLKIAKKYDVDVISVISPSSSKRIKLISQNASGFICECLSPNEFENEELVINSIKLAKENSSFPLFINYDVKNLSDIKKYLNYANGIIISTELVRIIENNKNDAPNKVFEFIKDIKENI